MKSSMLFLVTLTVCFRHVLGLACTNSPGISYIPCQNPGSLSGGSGGTGAAGSQDNTIAIQPCTDIQYSGGKPQKYNVANQGVPKEFELLFEDINVPDGEKLLIKNFKCDPNDECQIAVIDSTAATPFSILINKYSFALASPSSSVSATFKVNYNCPESPACDDDFDVDFGDKKIKILTSDMTFQQCFDICETNSSRMLKVVTQEDISALVTGSSPVWLGLQQITQTMYRWNDGETFTVQLANGNIPQYGSLNPWYAGITSFWDAVSLDDNNCMSIRTSGWSARRCDTYVGCVCECKLS